MSNRSILSIGQQVYGYTIEKHLGSGAFANVYLASKTNASGTHTIALKHIILPNEEDYNDVLRSMGGAIEQTEAHFKMLFENIIQEITTFKKLSLKSNNHIITYYDNDVEINENPLKYEVFIKMEYSTPITKQSEEQQLSIQELLKMCEHILIGLKVCHDTGVIHRDIKDDNLFINSDGMYKIADFGVSTLLKKNERAKTQKGTPAFIAPEVMNGGQQTYDHTIDLYSLGIVLYKFFNSNRLPLLPPAPQSYTMDDVETAVANRLKGEQLPAPSHSPAVVADFILKACAPRAQRFNSADEMLDALYALKEQLTDAQLQTVVLTLNVMPKASTLNEGKESVEALHEGIDLFEQSNSQDEQLQNKVAQLNDSEVKELGHLGETKGAKQPYSNTPTSIEKVQQNLFDTNKHRLSSNGVSPEVAKENSIQNVKKEMPTNFEKANGPQPSTLKATEMNNSQQRKILPIKENYERHYKSETKVWPYVTAIGALLGIGLLLYIDVFNFIESIPVVSTIFNRYIALGIITLALIIVGFALGKKLNAADYNNSLYVRYKGTEAVDEMRSIQTTLKMAKTNPHVEEHELKFANEKIAKLIEKMNYAGDFGLKNPRVYEVEHEIAEEMNLLKKSVEIFCQEGRNHQATVAACHKLTLLMEKRKSLMVR